MVGKATDRVVLCENPFSHFKIGEADIGNVRVKAKKLRGLQQQYQVEIGNLIMGVESMQRRLQEGKQIIVFFFLTDAVVQHFG